MENRPTPERSPDFEQVFVIYPFSKLNVFPLRDNEYIGIRPSERTRAQLMDRKVLYRCFILSPVSFRKADYTLHRQLRAIDNNLLISQLGIEQVVILIRVGALRFTAIGKKQLLWEAHLMMSKHKPVAVGMALFETESRKPILPPLEEDILEDYYDEIELIGFCVTRTLFDLTKSDYRGDMPASELHLHEGKIVRVVGDFVCEKFVKTKRGDLMKFGTFLDAEGRFFDTVHFPQKLVKYPLRGAGIYLIEGKVIVEYGCPSIEVIRCAKMPLKPDPRSE